MLRTAILPILLSLVLAPAAVAASAGDLDPSFDGDGELVLPVGGSPQDVLIQPDGKLVLAGTNDENLGAWRLNPDGSPDRGFDDEAAALQPDGKILVVGSTAMRPAVARFTAGGSLDPSFDPGGDDGDGRKVLVSSDGLSADGVVVQRDGRIAVVGSRWASQKPADFIITRLRPNGAPDEARAPEPADFGGGDWAVAGAAAPEGKILVVGTSQAAGATQKAIAVARYNADGSLDKTFAETGKKTLGPGEPVSVAAQPDGKALVVLRSANGDPSVTRLTNEGEVDASFGEGGTAEGGFDGEKLAYKAVAAVRPDGGIFVAGTPLGATGFAIGRLGPTGALDASFGSGGRATIGFPSIAVVAAAAVQPDGKLVVAGATLVGVAARLAVVRVLGDATPPPSGGTPDPVTPPAPRCAGRTATIVGTASGDTLRGTPRADVIVALGGSDTVLARGGNDVVCGGAGNDRLSGGPGRDLLKGGAGRDRLAGGTGRDRCVGAGGRDRAAACERRSSL